VGLRRPWRDRRLPLSSPITASPHHLISPPPHHLITS
jgi:hypothetical protein